MIAGGAPFTVLSFVAQNTGVTAEIGITFQDASGAEAGRASSGTGTRRAVTHGTSHLPVVPRRAHIAVVPGGVVPTVQTLPSFRVTGVTVVVATAGYARGKERAGSSAPVLRELPPVVTRCTVLTRESSRARRTETLL